jgi:hypothetical protein
MKVSVVLVVALLTLLIVDGSCDDSVRRYECFCKLSYDLACTFTSIDEVLSALPLMVYGSTCNHFVATVACKG